MLNFCTLSSLNNLRICFNYSRRENKNSGGNLRHQRNYPFYHTPLEFSSNVFNQYCADSRCPFVSFVGKLIMLWLNLNNNLKIEMGDRWANLQRESFSSKRKNDFCSAVNLRHNFYSNRVVPNWNRLSHHVTSAPSINSFKARLDKRNKTAAIVQTGCHRLGICT